MRNSRIAAIAVLVRRDAVEHVEKRAAQGVTEPVVREDVEERHDLVDVT